VRSAAFEQGAPPIKSPLSFALLVFVSFLPFWLASSMVDFWSARALGECTLDRLL